mmetsp:Transcript_126179/g.403845  ORF Transcript_126179/g.403845 Transcript_126179/m.403845 type:complete len:200 (+) Transcript_126179:3723-4322(+)
MIEAISPSLSSFSSVSASSSPGASPMSSLNSRRRKEDSFTSPVPCSPRSTPSGVSGGASFVPTLCIFFNFTASNLVCRTFRRYRSSSSFASRACPPTAWSRASSSGSTSSCFSVGLGSTAVACSTKDSCSIGAGRFVLAPVPTAWTAAASSFSSSDTPFSFEWARRGALREEPEPGGRRGTGERASEDEAAWPSGGEAE